jgi:hypothetical protein
MFTLICDHLKRGRAIFAALALVLVGCAEQPAEAPALHAVALFEGDVVVAGPEGYCIDQSSLKQRVQGSFVLLASCESLTGKRGRQVPPAVMTVLVLPQSAGAGLPKPADLAGALTPIEAVARKDLSLVYLPRGGDDYVPGGDPKHWRAGMVVNGHMIGLAVYGLKGSAASKATGKRLIMGLAARIRRKSPVRAVNVAASEAEE